MEGISPLDMYGKQPCLMSPDVPGFSHIASLLALATIRGFSHTGNFNVVASSLFAAFPNLPLDL